MGSRFAGFRDFSAGVLFWVIIAVIILFGAWMIIGVVGNCTNFGVAEAPDIKKAGYEVRIVSNGRVLYTDDYDKSGSGDDEIFTLHGYYDFTGGKFKRYDRDLTLNEYYYGPIQVVKR